MKLNCDTWMGNEVIWMNVNTSSESHAAVDVKPLCWPWISNSKSTFCMFSFRTFISDRFSLLFLSTSSPQVLWLSTCLVVTGAQTRAPYGGDANAQQRNISRMNFCWFWSWVSEEVVVDRYCSHLRNLFNLLLSICNPIYYRKKDYNQTHTRQHNGIGRSMCTHLVQC